MAMMQRERTFYDHDSAHLRESPREGPESDMSLSESSDQWMGAPSPISRPISLADNHSPGESPTMEAPVTPCPERPRPCSPRRSRSHREVNDPPVVDSAESARLARPKSASHFRRRMPPSEEDRSSVPPPESTRPRGRPDAGGTSRNRPKSARHSYGRRQPQFTSIDLEEEDLNLETLSLEINSRTDDPTIVTSPAYSTRSEGSDPGDRSLLHRRKQHDSWDRLPDGLGDQTPRQVGERVAERYRRRASSDVTPIVRDFSKQPQESREVKPKGALPRKLRPIFNSVGSSPQIDLDSKQSPRSKDSSRRPVINDLPASMQKSKSVDGNPILRNPQSVHKTRARRQLKPLANPSSLTDDFDDDDDLGIEIDVSSSGSADDSDSDRPVFDLNAAEEAGRVASDAKLSPLTGTQSDRRSRNFNKENVRQGAVRTKSIPTDKGKPQDTEGHGKKPVSRTKSHPQQYM